jgi:hypothetical protein
MKLRIHGDSIRFRFDRREVARLSAGEGVASAIRLGPGAAATLSYRVVPVLAGPPLAARMDGQQVTVEADLSAIRNWCEGPELSLQGAQECPDGGVLQILLEKDLQRLNPKPGDNTADVYPNPKFGIERCDHP